MKDAIQPQTRGIKPRRPNDEPTRGLSRKGPAKILTVNNSEGSKSRTFRTSRLNKAKRFRTNELIPKTQITVFKLIALLKRSSGRSSRGPPQVRKAMLTPLASSGEA